MKILGLNAYHGDAAAALLVDGRLVAAAAEERFNRHKHCAGFPRHAVGYCLHEAGIGLGDLDHVAVSRKPWANLSSKLRHVLLSGLWLRRNTWKSAGSTLAVSSVRARFEELHPGGLPAHVRLHNVEHHLAHAASAFFVSPFERSAILTLDGFGDFCSGLIGMGEGSRIRVLQRIHFPHSLGIFYTALTQFLGFPHYGDEGKVMALASLGKPTRMEEMRRLMGFDPDGLIRLGLDYFTHHTRGVAMTWSEGSPMVGELYSDKLIRLLGPPRKIDEPLDVRFLDVAASMQAHLEEVVLKLAGHLADLTGETRLCYAGGVALNSVVNRRISPETPFKQLYIQPAAGDDGTALGAAFYVQHQLCGKKRSFEMKHASWGPSFGEEEILKALLGKNLKVRRVDHPERDAARCIAEGSVVGWFQGRMEFGPRALGNRSILADPRRAGVKEILNARVKHRESFRPFAPSVLGEDVADFFERGDVSPFMLLVFKARSDQISKIPGALHVDGTGRLQTVHREQNPVYYELISEFKKLTGTGLIINTSFNDSEPMVCTPEDAIQCFLQANMDVLFMEHHEVRRL